MKKWQKFLRLPFLLMGVFLVVASSCDKDDDYGIENVPVLSTTEVTEVTTTTATSGGNITDDGGTTVTARGVCWSTNENPTIDDNKTEDGSGPGSFTSNITNLEPNKTYFLRAYAINSAGNGYGSAKSFTTEDPSSGTYTDARDGNVYNWVKIGSQVWMAENLAYLPGVNQVAVGSEDAPGSYYYVYGYDGTNVTDAKATSNYTSFGVLYNWTAAMDGEASSTTNPSGIQGVCPTGWHLPSDAEWTELTDYLGGTGVAGGKLKATGTIEAGTGLWYDPNTGATNETCFTAHPGGYRNVDGSFYGIGNYGSWWSTTEYSTYGAYYLHLNYYESYVYKNGDDKGDGFSVRCLRD